MFIRAMGGTCSVRERERFGVDGICWKEEEYCWSCFVYCQLPGGEGGEKNVVVAYIVSVVVTTLNILCTVPIQRVSRTAFGVYQF